MSIKIMSHVWESSPSAGKELLVELALADFANDDGECFPAVSTLAKKARCSESTVHNVIRHLTEQRRLVVHVAGSDYGTNVYRWLNGGAFVDVPTQGGATIAPPPADDAGNDAKLHPPGATHYTPPGAIQHSKIAPDPLYNRHIEPSENHQRSGAPDVVGQLDVFAQNVLAQLDTESIGLIGGASVEEEQNEVVLRFNGKPPQLPETTASKLFRAAVASGYKRVRLVDATAPASA